jgi:hypothetical protein
MLLWLLCNWPFFFGLRSELTGGGWGLGAVEHAVYIGSSHDAACHADDAASLGQQALTAEPARLSPGNQF